MNKHSDETETYGNHPRSFLAGVLMGGLAGAGAMLLLAPRSGKRTRAQIQLMGLELRDQATEALEDGVAQTRVTARQLKTDIRAKAKEIQHSGQEMLDEQTTRLSTAVAAGKTAVFGYQG
jgi:gas vesicle protein